MVGFVMGVDGGGTHTEYVLVDAQSHQRIGGGLLGPLSPFCGEAQLEATAAGLSQAIRRSGLPCLALRAGCAGAGEPERAEQVRRALLSAGIDCPVTVVGDHENALDTAFGREDGAVLISGTGSVCCARHKGAFLRAGGRGHVFDDGGSGYAIGRDMLAAVARAADGRGPATKLTDIVRELSGLRDIGAIASFYSDPARSKSEIAALAKPLGAAAAAGDEAALLILEKAAGELSELACAVLQRLWPDCTRLALAGSVLIGNSLLRERLEQRIAEKYPLTECFVLYTRAAEGAAAYALGLLRRGA